MIKERTKLILKTIVKEHIKTAQPVSSSILVDKYKLDISPATVRNEMVQLEQDGYILQPHTSAGRVPTEVGYCLVLEDVLKEKPAIDNSELKGLKNIFSDNEESFKKTAKEIARLSDSAVFWAFHKNDLYYTGLSNLFSQPEFKEVDVVQDFSAIIDRMEEIIDDIFDDLDLGEHVLIGSKNPFGNFLSVVLVKYKKNKKSGIFGILGPMRMDYNRNLVLTNFIKNKFK